MKKESNPEKDDDLRPEGIELLFHNFAACGTLINPFLLPRLLKLFFGGHAAHGLFIVPAEIMGDAHLAAQKRPLEIIIGQ